MPLSIRTRAPIPKIALPPPIVQASIAGEVSKIFGGNDRAVEISQRGVYAALLEKIEILGLDQDGRRRAHVTFSFTPEGIDSILVEDDATRSMTERLSGGLSAAIDLQAARFRRLGLTTDIYFGFPEHIRNDPQRYEAAMAELGLHTQQMQAWAEGYEGREILNVAPSGSGIFASFKQAFKR